MVHTQQAATMGTVAIEMQYHEYGSECHSDRSPFFVEGQSHRGGPPAKQGERLGGPAAPCAAQRALSAQQLAAVASIVHSLERLLRCVGLSE